MEKYYVIIVDASEEWHRQVWKSRIEKIGAFSSISDYQFFVKSKLSSEEIFSGLTRGFENPLRAIIVEVDSSNMFGCMHKDVLSFFKKVDKSEEK